jgi:predicted permease
VSRLRQTWQRALALLRPRRWDRDFSDEVESHLALAADDLARQGLPPAEARRRARLTFGSTLSAAELHRDTRGVPWLDHLRRDLVHGWRGLRRDAGLTATAVLILAIGIGANTAVFSVISPVVLKPLPFYQPDELVWIANTGTTGLSGATFQVGAYEGMQKFARSFRDWTAFFAFSDFGNHTLVGRGDPERIRIVDVAPRFFELLGVPPLHGRLFRAEEQVPNGPRVVVLSHDYWQRRLGADVSLVGTPITIDAERVLIAGVLPPSFDFASVFAPGTTVDMFRPAILGEMREWGNTLSVIGRLNRGVTAAQARTELDAVIPVIRQADPSVWPFGTTATPLRETVSGAMRRPLYVLAGAVGLVLLIVCANVSNLLLARSTTRAREFALRLALGADRRRIVQQVTLEGLMLAGCGAALGVPLAFWLTQWVKSGSSLAIPLLYRADVDAAALAVAIALACLTGVAFSVLPALRLSATRPQAALVDRSPAGGARHAWMRSALVVSEVALASVLLFSAGLLLKSFAGLLDADLGFRPAGASALTLRLPDDHANVNGLLAEAVTRVARLPGVEAAALTDALPLARNRSWGIGVPGQTYRPGERPAAFTYVVGPGYLKAMGMTLIAGRDFTVDDTASRPPVVIVSETLARTLYPNEAPIGRLAQIRGAVGSEPHTIVGVVADVRQTRLDQAAAAQMYVPYAQGGGLPADLIVRSDAVPVAAIRRELSALDSRMLVTDVRPVAELVDRSVSPRRFLVSVLTAFAIFALVLASLGIYGVVSYGVTQRSQEIGVRMALGASSHDVRRDVLRRTLSLALAGAAAGLAMALLAGRVVEALLFETSPTDLRTFVWTAAILLAVATAAGYLPARRASRIMPLDAIRN